MAMLNGRAAKKVMPIAMMSDIRIENPPVNRMRSFDLNLFY